MSGFETTSLYDEFFRLVGTEQSIDLDGDGSTEQVATDTEFDILGRQKATIDANQNRTTYSYNGVGQLISTLFDDGSSTSTIYNDLGQRKSEIDPLGNQTDYQYNLGGQLSKVTLPAVAAGTAVYDYFTISTVTRHR